jgi:hypothetical protein
MRAGRLPRLALAGLLLASCAPPASAHPGVWQWDRDGATYYYVENHAFTGWFEETNGKPTQGAKAQNYDTEPQSFVERNDVGDTGLQMHDVCYGLFTQLDVNNEANADPHFAGDPEWNYLPWQANASGVADEASVSSWLQFWKTTYGDDLVALATRPGGLPQACADLGGTFVPRDARLSGGETSLQAPTGNTVSQGVPTWMTPPWFDQDPLWMPEHADPFPDLVGFADFAYPVVQSACLEAAPVGDALGQDLRPTCGQPDPLHGIDPLA